MSVDAIILAAGNSSRMDCNKLLYPIGESSLIEQTVKAFSSVERISKIFIVTNDEKIKSLFDFEKEMYCHIQGGKTRTQSVLNALQKSQGDYVLIHDGARPFVSQELINRAIDSAIKNASAIPVIPVPDSIRKTSKAQIVDFVDRNDFFLAQTPQGFNGNMIRQAYHQVKEQSFTDDSEVFAKYISMPFIIEGEESNKKITYNSDLPQKKPLVGNGFDLHKLQEGLPLILGGIKIPHNKGLKAHSDGDALVHAIMDSLLSAAGERDIGCLFPDTDKSYKNISSIILLKKVRDILIKKNISIINISAVIMAQKPKLQDYIPLMCENIAKVLEIKNTQVSISCTTTEGVGDIGKQECISVYAVCSCC